jgi:4-diphosphocytidyl-2-C-methyl-D-erythritol kinase
MTSPGVITEHARAKINLALHVTARRDDGYHELDSIVAFADVGDVLTFARSETDSFVITGPFATNLDTGLNNIVIKARDLIRTRLDTGPVSIALHKNLPVASGIGGGSADAAATLRGLNRMSVRPLAEDQLAALALQLGADVPVCLKDVACRMRGIGEIIEPFRDALPPVIVLVNPLQSLATKDVFDALGLAHGQRFSAALDPSDQATWRNDLTKPAITLLPVIADVLGALRRPDQLSRFGMSGSGATCFGLAADVETGIRCRDQITSMHPAWWVAVARLQSMRS